MKIEELTEEALALPNEAKALLVDRLVESLDPSQEGELHDLWVVEAQRRPRELRSGAVQAIPGDEALARMREKYPG